MTETFLLEMKGIKKYFGGIKALDGVDFQLKKGEVHALIGENGAGKSTLMKILGGVYKLDDGQICINGKHVKISSPVEAQKYGIAFIYQEQALVNCLTVADNILLGRIPNKKGVINKKRLTDLAISAMKHVGANFDPSREIRELTIAQRQFVEIAKAISIDARIIVMDEPTAVLTLPETEVLFKLIHDLQKQGRSIIYISHRLEELYEIADTCTVLKDGKYIGTHDIKDVNKELLIKLMTGREILNIYPYKAEKVGPEVLKVSGMTRQRVFKDISFNVHEKEVIGMAGLVGSGRTEVARAIFGADQIDCGEIIINGEKVNIKNPTAALEKGIVYITEDRKGNGIFLRMPIDENVTISTMKKWSKAGVIQRSKEKNAVLELVNKLKVKCSDMLQAVGELSGGNQQKVMLARGLLLTNSKIVIIDEPTRGVDVGTKVEIYKIIRSIAEEGKAVIMISSELPEIIGMSDKIIVMHQGEIVSILENDGMTEEKILSCATGGN